MKNKSLIATIFVLVAIIALAAAVYPSLAKKATENTTTEQVSISDTIQYQRYRDIEIFDKDGNPVNLSDFEGKPIIVNFWALWCGYCLQEMPDFEAAYKEYGDEVQFLIVNTADGLEKGGNYIADKGYTFPAYYDLQYDASMTYGVASSLPRTVAIDKDGNVRYNRAGMVDAETLESIINMIK